jgi:hypothetical protein
MKAIEIYQGPMSAEALIASLEQSTLETPQTITKVIEFLQECRKPSSTELTVASTQSPATANNAALEPLDDTPLDLMNELTYNYKIAKRILQQGLVQDRSTDAEESRKSLRTISAFMEQALKLQERLYNTQQLQKFQEAVLDTIATVDPVYRDVIIQRMLESNL